MTAIILTFSFDYFPQLELSGNWPFDIASLTGHISTLFLNDSVDEQSILSL